MRRARCVKCGSKRLSWPIWGDGKRGMYRKCAECGHTQPVSADDA